MAPEGWHPRFFSGRHIQRTHRRMANNKMWSGWDPRSNPLCCKEKGKIMLQYTYPYLKMCPGCIKNHTGTRKTKEKALTIKLQPWTRGWNQHCTKEICKVNKQEKSSSISFAVMEMQIPATISSIVCTRAAKIKAWKHGMLIGTQQRDSSTRIMRRLVVKRSVFQHNCPRLPSNLVVSWLWASSRTTRAIQLDLWQKFMMA